ncbi:MAG: hypothetical protein AAB588_01860 [Patescibacteria group bacterium]
MDASSHHDSENEIAERILFGNNHHKEEPEDERVDEELKNSAKELKGIDFQDVTHLLTALAEALKNRDDQKTEALLWQLDQSEPLINLRNWWDRRSSIVQKYLNNFSLFAPLFNGLVMFGFLDLKGITMEEIDKRSDLITKIGIPAEKAGVHIAGFLMAEILPFKPLINVCIALQEHGYAFAKKSRHYLARRREQEAAIEKRKKHHSEQSLDAAA